MKKISLLLLLLLCITTTVGLIGSVSYADEPSTWSKESVEALKETGFFDYEKFENYQDNITREEFIYWAVTLYEILQNEEIEVDQSITFSDTTNEYALKAATVGITSGVGNGKFAPNQLLDRQTMVTFYMKLLNLGQMDLLDVSEEIFLDDADIAEWAKPSVYRSRANNIVSGVGNNKFDAKGLASSEVCMILTKKILFESEGKTFTTNGGINVVSIEESRKTLSSLAPGYTHIRSDVEFNATKENTINIPLEEGDLIDSVGLYKGENIIQAEIEVDGTTVNIKSSSELPLNSEFTLKIFTMNGKRYSIKINTPKVFDFKKEEWITELYSNPNYYNSISDYTVNKVYSFVFKIPANPGKGFNYPYYIGVPATVANNPSDFYELLVNVNNTGSTSSINIFFEEMAKNEITKGMVKTMANGINGVTIMPIFPRPSLAREYYTHTLDRDSFFVTEDIIEKAKVGDFTRLDLQLKAMIEDAVIQFRGNGFNVSEKPIMVGFSASSGFANRYAMIHPESVKAVAVQHHTMMPIAEYEGNTLNFPSGVADLKELTGKEFNEKAYKALPQFWFRGSVDYNDPTYFYDGWGREGDEYRRIFGEDITVRKDNQVPMLKEKGFNNILFKEYENIGHSYTLEMNKDFIRWYNSEVEGR